MITSKLNLNRVVLLKNLSSYTLKRIWKGLTGARPKRENHMAQSASTRQSASMRQSASKDSSWVSNRALARYIYYIKCLNISSLYFLLLLLCFCFCLCFCFYLSLCRVYCSITSDYHCQYKLCRLNCWWWDFMCRVSICKGCWYKSCKFIHWWWGFICWYKPLRLIYWQWFTLWGINIYKGYQYRFLKFIY